MTYDFFMGQLRLLAIGVIAWLSGAGKITPADATAATAVLAPLGLLVAPWLWSLYRNFGKKLVPSNSTALDVPPYAMPAPGNTVTNITAKVVGCLAFLFLVPGAFAADLSAKAPLFPAPVANCTPQACSGWYAGFSVMGDGSNVDIAGQGINGSVFSTGGVLKLQGGYQLWYGQWFAAIEADAGYEFTTNTSAGIPTPGGSKFVGTEIAKLGYNFFNGSAPASLTLPSQAPISQPVVSSILASSTPYLAFGGLQRRGISEWVNGAGIETFIAQGWSSNVEYLYAPSQQGIPATSLVTIGLNKHF